MEIETTQTHDGIYIRNNTILIYIADEDIREKIEEIHRTGKVTDRVKSLEIPQEERSRVMNNMLERIRVFESQR